MDYDELLKIIGEFGVYQAIVFLLASLASIQLVLNNMAVVFLVASPDHYCKVPQLDHLNLTEEVVKHLTIPYIRGSYDKCSMYNRNYTSWTLADVEAALSANSSNVTAVSCQYGWTYDTSIYQSTVVTDVSMIYNCKVSFVYLEQCNSP